MVGSRLLVALLCCGVVAAMATESPAPERQFQPPPGFAGSNDVVGGGLNFSPAEDVFGLSGGLLPPVALTPSSPQPNWAQQVTSVTNTTAGFGAAAIYTALPPLPIPLPGDTLGRTARTASKHPTGLQQTTDFACLTLTRESKAVSTYWENAAEAGAESSSVTPTDAADVTSEYTGDSVADWCIPPPPQSWYTEPFTVRVWGPLLILSIGFVGFWAVRGFRTP